MYSCIDCGYLDKSRKNISTESECFQYGCNYKGKDKYMCGWCKSDKDLKTSHLGCSNWIGIKKQEVTETQLQGQMSIMDFIVL